MQFTLVSAPSLPPFPVSHISGSRIEIDSILFDEAKLLKLCVRQERPIGTEKITYGMPSSHSTVITFFGVYLLSALILFPLHSRIKSLFSDNSTGQDLKLRVALGVIVLSSAGLVCWSRISLGYHSNAQVFAGIGLGIIVACGWLSIWLGIGRVLSTVGLAGLQGTSEKLLPKLIYEGIESFGVEFDRVLEIEAIEVMAIWKAEGVWTATQAILAKLIKLKSKLQ